MTVSVAQGYRLNLGCGHDRPEGEGWIHVDRDPAVGADVVLDLNRALPWPTGHFDELYACHVMEHVPFWRQLIGECFRVLAPWGKLTIRVPDLDYAIRLYLTGETPKHFHAEPGRGSAKPIGWEHLIYGDYWDRAAGAGHVMGFSWATGRDNDLAEILEKEGFVNVHQERRFDFEICAVGQKP